MGALSSIEIYLEKANKGIEEVPIIFNFLIFTLAVTEPECLHDHFVTVVSASFFNMTLQHTLTLCFSGRYEE